jgi:hypothetical protein
VLVALAGPSASSATTIEYSADGLTFMVNGGDNATHELQFRFAADDTDDGVDNPYDEFIDSVGFTSYPDNCAVVGDAKRIKCPVHGYLRLDLGGGDDAVYFTGSNFDCYSGYELNLGEGANRLYLSEECQGGGKATVTSGAGPDSLFGGAQATVSWSTGGGDDNVTGGSAADVIHGGEGADRLIGGPGNDEVFGDGGPDRPGGGAGDDLVDGGEGDDLLERTGTPSITNDKGEGADRYVGGPGTDQLVLDAHAAGMAISIDGQANDGAAGEGDNVGADIESILGSPVGDVFQGGPAADNFNGGGGNDEIHGNAGDDLLNGGSGDDKLFGEAGADKVEGSNGSDTVDGGPGQDGIFGDTAACSVFCAFDADVIFARDGERDVVDCGGGADQATVDEVDVVAYCSTVLRAAGGGGGGGAPPPPPPAAAATLTTTGAARIRTGVPLAVTCPASCRFSVSLTVSARTARRHRLASTRLGTASGTLLQAGRKATRLRLSAKARRRLRRARSVSGTLRLKATDAAGKATTVSKPVTLRR